MKRHAPILIIAFVVSLLLGSSMGWGGTIINLKVDIKTEKKLQKAVDKGHQPWRLDLTEVAQTVVTNRFDEDCDCHILSETEKNGQVACKGKRDYVVSLRRLVKPKGIWTAVRIEIR